MTAMKLTCLVLCGLLWSGCEIGSLEETPGTEAQPEGEFQPVTPPEPASVVIPEVDLCDDASYAGIEFLTVRSEHFVINYLPGTAAERDQDEIIRRLEDAYTGIRAALGVEAVPVFSVYLSPNRQAAAAHGRGYGRAWPGQDRYEVIYSGAPGSYELERFGHEITHLLQYYLGTGGLWSHPMFTEGLAETLDRSGRNMHEAYAQQLLAGAETRVRVATFENKDLTASNYGRAGSLVKFLIDRYGMPKFIEILRGTTVTWTNGCWVRAPLGCISTPDTLAALLDSALVAAVNERWTTVQVAWEATVQRALASVDVRLPAKDEAEIKNLIQVMDLAVTTGDATTYRRTMDGFYCEANTDTLRSAVAARAVSAFHSVSSRVEAIYATGIRNFRTAQVVVRRTDDHERSTFSSLYVEHFPVGWRVTWGPDWY